MSIMLSRVFVKTLRNRAISRWSSSSGADPRVVQKLVGDGIVHVELNRGEKMNALDMNMFDELTEVASKLSKERGLRAVVLSGKGKSFCAGLDVKKMAMNSPLDTMEKLLKRPAGHPWSNLAQDMGYLWRQIPVPVICAVHGVCYGGGLQIALGADFRIAGSECKFSIMESKWGLIPDMSGSITLRELVRIDVAKELTMTGRVFLADEALRLGIVTRITQENPVEVALKLAQELSQRSPDALAASKRLFQESWVAPEEECLALETDLQRKLLPSWNQLVQSANNFSSMKLPFKKRDESI
jgi:enoyl-CoA hydratase/carnithine racemase